MRLVILSVKHLYILFFLFLIFSCDNKEETIEEEFIVPTIKSNGSEQYLNLSSDFIFDQNELRTFELKLSEKDLEYIDNDPTAEQYVETFPTSCSKNPFNDNKIKGLYMKSFWVNFSKQHEFNPVHDHNGVLSFVLWMKIPTKWQEQHELPISSDSNLPCASNFQFFYNDIFGSTRGIVVEMDPMMEGCILMFPSILQHQVYPFYNSDGYRISISGNLCFDPKSLKDML